MAALRPLMILLATVALLLAACGDDDDLTVDDDPGATVLDDDDGAIGEDVDNRPGDFESDDDSQTNTTTTAPDELVPEPGEVLVTGDFATGDIRLLLTEDASCAIRIPEAAGGEAAAEARGATEDGDRFTLDWSIDAGTLVSELVLDGETWTADTDLDEADEPVVQLTQNGELLIETTFSSDAGQETDAVLFVNCRPETV